MPRSARHFAIHILSALITSNGLIITGGQKRLMNRYGMFRGRKPVSRQWIQRMIAQLVDAGVLERVQHSGSHQQATYRAVGVTGRVLMWVRGRGVTPRRLHAAFTAELEAARACHTPEVAGEGLTPC